MAITKALKNLIVALPVIILSACSSQRMLNNADLASMSADANTAIDINNNNTFSNDQEAPLNMKKPQCDNVVYFDLDKYDIFSAYTQMLNAHATFLRINPLYTVTVEGHADEHGTPEYNIALGERRANALKIYLQGQGVPADQIAIVSYGKEKPAVLGHDEAAYAKNRRAVLSY
ncbi:peptidoglycan-associated lipoprotein Pal [secondary endosymbiont of Ctenarytaina eucalypti]|uniref:Peptidoglycan-associated lipoprotein n=1 Tax=secondary endosymbiont of Ctenarytaina eucalypti TaxID=1199245 RepID=J3TFJ7_9ENTR|nr:peptidoglycan-associated lipoprotein Pal [secondary endosymbiont of Ctenarytaina eucalypti]AFP85022.1 peptidoglycan-associated lipoprotein [secondary endosymbiont of Ctenarytaina eucalypti]